MYKVCCSCHLYFWNHRQFVQLGRINAEVAQTVTVHKPEGTDNDKLTSIDDFIPLHVTRRIFPGVRLAVVQHLHFHALGELADGDQCVGRSSDDRRTLCVRQVSVAGQESIWTDRNNNPNPRSPADNLRHVAT